MFPSKILIKAYCWLNCKKPNSINKSCNYITSFAASIKKIYLASKDEKAIVGYFFEYQFTRPPLSMKIKSKIDFQLFLSTTQSKLEYFSTNSLFWQS